MASSNSKKIAFFHPDLGIGGAERLVIDAAVGLQSRGHKVVIFTSHCDPTHCFEEARDGTLDVRVRGNTVVPPTILGRLAILCAILRQLHLVLQISIFSSELQKFNASVFFVDQLSAGIPLLRLLSPRTRVLFYCHFPDKLLAKRSSMIKSIYRLPFDWIESWSTGCSDGIVVNSKFTRGIFGEAFPLLKHREPKVVYPCVDTSPTPEGIELDNSEPLWKGIGVFLSINRFERKKDVGLAIRAYGKLSAEQRKDTRLVLAGGYDPRVTENVAYHKELCELADSLGLKHATAKAVVTALAVPSDVTVLFLLSIPSSLKSALLSSAILLIYTPRNEHLGIVPLEAMLSGVPVLAANEGGPTETVVEGQTGWLRDVSKADDWALIMQKILDGEYSEQLLQAMGENGQRRVKDIFSKGKMASRLDDEIDGLMSSVKRPPVVTTGFIGVAVLLFGALIALIIKFLA